MTLAVMLQQQPPLSAGVIGAVNAFTDFLLQYAIALAAVGALAMALIELWKKLFDSRTKFQAKRWVEWMAQNPLENSTTSAFGELLQLCTGVSVDEGLTAARNLIDARGSLPWSHGYSPPPAHALFALDLGRMMGSIQDAADVALASPRENRSLYLLMTRGAAPNDVTRWYVKGAESLPDMTVAEPTAEDRRLLKEHADRFARLRQIVKRKLDGFQLYTGDRWASRNQLAANLVGIVLMYGVLQWMQTHAGTSFGMPVTIAASLLGGMLSPVAKDLVSALKRVKDG